MLKMGDTELPQGVVDYLSEKQESINVQPDYPSQVAKGKQLWGGKSRTQFRIIRDKLDLLCVGKRRCNYCEDSVADEVEHIKPKNIYPEDVFIWFNYLFACGNCNGPKSNKFAVFVNDEVTEVSRKRGDAIVPPQTGEAAFLNPRIDDPLHFMILDLRTLQFIARPGLSAQEKARAKYTIKILHLNSRDFLTEARKEAFNTYKDSLELYVRKKAEGAAESELVDRKVDIESRHHPTVWHEMQRQRNNNGLQWLAALFEQASELIF